jgi:hypothetical protein
MTILSPKDLSLNKEEEKELISPSKLSKIWVNWNKEFLERVKIDGEKDKKYQKELEILRTEKQENEQNILHQEEGILFRTLRL